jgi:hypothetical protein
MQVRNKLNDPSYLVGQARKIRNDVHARIERKAISRKELVDLGNQIDKYLAKAAQIKAEQQASEYELMF